MTGRKAGVGMGASCERGDWRWPSFAAAALVYACAARPLLAQPTTAATAPATSQAVITLQPWQAPITADEAASAALPAARMEPGVEDSVDTAVLAADVILCGRITTVTPIKAGLFRLTIDVSEVLKGTAAHRVEFIAPDFASRPPLQSFDNAWTSEHPCLCFLSRSTRSNPWGEPLPPEIAVGTLIAWPVNFTAIQFLDDSLWPSFRGDLSELRGTLEVLSYTRQLVRKRANALGELSLLHPTYGTTLYGRTWTVTVPLTAELREKARGWVRSASPATRVNAVRVLATNPRPEQLDSIIALLSDPFAMSDDRVGSYHGRDYLVRREAYEALRRWGIAVRRPVIREPDDLRLPLSWKFVATVVLGFVLSFVALLVWRSRGGETRPRRRRLVRWKELTIAAVVLLLWARSQWVVYQLRLESGPRCLELSFVPDGVRLVRVESWPPSAPLTVAAFPIDAELDQAWKLPSEDGSCQSFRTSRWMTRGSGQFGVMYRLHRVIHPYVEDDPGALLGLPCSNIGPDDAALLRPKCPRRLSCQPQALQWLWI